MKKLVVFLFLLLIFPTSIKAIDTSATSAILMDQDSGRIIYAKNINNVRSVASISKIMTATIAVESGKLKNKVIVGEEISKAYGSGIYIKKGEVLTLENLLYGLMLRSGNDAALSIANYVGGSTEKFVELMNSKAIDIGMKNTTFNNPHGLDEDKANYSTAYDMAILTSFAMKNKDYRDIVKTKKYKLKTNMNTYIWHNKHKLLNMYKNTTGGKTGFTKIAKRTLVTTATKNNLNLVVVTLNDGNDFQDHIDLFEYGFNNYKSYQILKKGNIDIEDSYYKNYKKYIKNDLKYPIMENEKAAINIKYKIEKGINLKNETRVGYAYIYLGDKEVLKEPIYINNVIKKTDSTWTKFKKWISKLW